MINTADRKKQHGGKREGAGLKELKGSDKRKMISIRMDPYLIDRLKEAAAESKASQADQIDKALRGFYGW